MLVNHYDSVSVGITMPPADLQKIERHGECVLKWPDFALRPVIPVNANLRIAQPSFASQMKELNIKGKSVQGQPSEKVLGRVTHHYKLSYDSGQR